MGRDDRHQEGNQADQVVVIEVAGLFDQEEVREDPAEDDRRHPVEVAEGHQDTGDSQEEQQGLHDAHGQGTDEVQESIGEVEGLREPVMADPVAPVHPPGVPGDDQPEHEPEDVQARRIYRPGEPAAKAVQEREKQHLQGYPGNEREQFDRREGPAGKPRTRSCP